VRTLILPLAAWLAAAAPPSTAATPTLDAKAAGELSSFLGSAVKRGELPGVVVLVTAKDRVLYHEAFGRLDVARGVAMRGDAIFRIASMTKPITSAAVMMLVEEGRLGLDDPVAKYLPAFELMQFLPFYDEAALGVLRGVETRVYGGLQAPAR
jgi:CubicO group peptidase (beta-lactamase class C family)